MAGAAATGLVVSLGFLSQHYNATYKSHLEFSQLARLLIFVSLVSIPLIAFVWAFGFWGFLLKNSIQQIIGLLILAIKPPLPVSPRWHSKHLWGLVKTGTPIAISWVLMQL